MLCVRRNGWQWDPHRGRCCLWMLRDRHRGRGRGRGASRRRRGVIVVVWWLKPKFSFTAMNIILLEGLLQRDGCLVVTKVALIQCCIVGLWFVWHMQEEQRNGKGMSSVPFTQQQQQQQQTLLQTL